MKIVIGSGPTGIACAQALCARGEEVLMVDAGIAPQPQEQILLDRAAQNDAPALRHLESLRAKVPITAKGVSIKLQHGSDFPYQGALEHLGFEGAHTGLQPSLALGGLSNVWGAAALPYLDRDMADWPIRTAHLSRHYEAVLRMTGITGQHDDLEKVFPFYQNSINGLKLSSQAERLLRGLNLQREDLHAQGLIFGASRLTLGPNQSQKQECVYCGQCLYGCPYGCIYNSAVDVKRLQLESNGRFRYRKDVIVETVTERNEMALLCGYDRATRVPVQVEGERVFIATGVLPTARLMLKSLDAYEHPLSLKDSQYFILPLLTTWSSPQVVQENLHTLSQLFIEIQDEEISSHTVHLQLYTYSDFIEKVLRKKLWFAPGLRDFSASLLRSRIMVIQGYLHSNDSGTVTVKLSRSTPTRREKLMIEPCPKPFVKETISRIIRKLAKSFSKMGVVPIRAALDITEPGRGFHSGGSFPMRIRPGSWECDLLGRPNGTSLTHLVDASTFPSIPATTITLTAMANAHRIGTDWDQAVL